ncbi:pesticin C-terminus-like muramidase [Pseudoalteromonas sp. MM17-2]|uniref:pesticin C-terminus-like muramidase n=1 Tax=Pseudoalteromonas sp. MM17-2 TaxID=2917753 RepID=UPI001EF682DC|nr:pesticin C-terminus-like muramidase [Pseudoalteromonas sp. MM17-2]MCG7545390.1 pesticin C-terminus-like muramidase [Pseudoalteromonas sp. MM17-2]
MSAVDFDFIEELEGNSLKGYVPDAENSKSGVTIGCGFDLGQRSEANIKKHFPVSLAEKLIPYCGLKGEKALKALSKEPLEVSEVQVRHINQYAKYHALRKLQSEWLEATGSSFAILCPKKQTVIASVAFQYGTLATRTPNFWRQITTGDWEGALMNLLNFGDRYSTRRHKEADLLASAIKESK